MGAGAWRGQSQGDLAQRLPSLQHSPVLVLSFAPHYSSPAPVCPDPPTNRPHHPPCSNSPLAACVSPCRTQATTIGWTTAAAATPRWLRPPARRAACRAPPCRCSSCALSAQWTRVRAGPGRGWDRGRFQAALRCTLGRTPCVCASARHPALIAQLLPRFPAALPPQWMRTTTATCCCCATCCACCTRTWLRALR